MYAYSIAQTALNTSQQVLDVIGQNLANSNTPGYSRQVADLVALVDGSNGDGVQVSEITRVTDQLTAAAVTRSNFESGAIDAQVSPLQQAQGVLQPSTGSLDSLIAQFYNGLAQLTSTPSDTTQRRIVLSDLNSVTSAFKSISQSLDNLRANVGTQITNTVNQINALTPQIASLNDRIFQAEAAGQHPNDLLDQRDQLINQLSQYVDVRTVNLADGVTNVTGGGVPLVVSNLSYSLANSTDVNGNAVISAFNSPVTPSVTSGQLYGLIQTFNTSLPGYRSRLDTLANSLAQQVDSVNATGLGLNQPETSALGTRPLNSATTPLNSAGTAFPVQAGTLEISITNQTTGVRTLVPVTIDPTKSLTQLAASITTATGGQVTGTVSTPNNTLQLTAASGYAFDFAGQLPTNPTYSGTFAGSTTPTLSGIYTGTSNDTYTFQVNGAGGTVGTTAGLSVNVLNSAGSVIQTLNIGQGYTAGTPLVVANGISVSFSAGTFTAGSFSDPVTANADTSGVLAALGINSLLTGSSAVDIAVNPAVTADPTLLAASRDGQPGDSSNLQRLIATRDNKSLAGNTQTLEQYYASLVGDLGGQVQKVQQAQTAAQAVAQQVQAQQQSVSGVDPNEELINMLRYQRSYQFAAQYLSTVNTALDSLLNVVL